MKWKWDIAVGVGLIFIACFVMLIIGSIIAKNYEGMVTWTITLVGFLGLCVWLLWWPLPSPIDPNSEGM